MARRARMYQVYGTESAPLIYVCAISIKEALSIAEDRRDDFCLAGNIKCDFLKEAVFTKINITYDKVTEVFFKEPFFEERAVNTISIEASNTLLSNKLYANLRGN